MNNPLNHWQRCARRLIHEAIAEGILLESDCVDHIGVKTLTSAEYLETKNEISTQGTLFSEVEINGRLIACFKLARPLEIDERQIFVLEIAAPKDGESKTGFDHVEVVILESFEKRRSRNSQLDWKSVRWPSILNPELPVSLVSGNIKFHFQTLEEVTKIEHLCPEVLRSRVPEIGKYSKWIFDLDGTLVSSHESIIECVWKFAQHKKLDVERLFVERNFAPTYEMFVTNVIGRKPSRLELDELERFELDCISTIKPIPPIVALLHHVKESGCETALWTARFRSSTYAILKQLNIDHLFDHIYTGNDFRKPSVVSELKEKSGQSIFLGDSASDFEAATMNGIHFLPMPKVQNFY